MANIGKSIVFKGELTGDEDLEIEGSIEGRIDLPKGQLTIGSHGRVKAEISAKAVVIIGKVTGNVSATERLEVQSSGIVEGDIRAPRLLIQEGAVVNGGIEMGGQAASPSKPATPPVQQAAAGGAKAS
ncbi:MAG: bactofilin family protein [Myxococcota bacterium]